MMFSRDPNDVTADDRSQCYYWLWFFRRNNTSAVNCWHSARICGYNCLVVCFFWYCADYLSFVSVCWIQCGVVIAGQCAHLCSLTHCGVQRQIYQSYKRRFLKFIKYNHRFWVTVVKDRSTQNIVLWFYVEEHVVISPSNILRNCWRVVECCFLSVSTGIQNLPKKIVRAPFLVRSSCGWMCLVSWRVLLPEINPWNCEFDHWFRLIFWWVCLKIGISY